MRTIYIHGLRIDLEQTGNSAPPDQQHLGGVALHAFHNWYRIDHGPWKSYWEAYVILTDLAKHLVKQSLRENADAKLVRQRNQFYDYARDQLGDERIHREMVHKIIEYLPLDQLEKLFPIQRSDDAEPRGKPGPVLHTYEIQITI